MAGGVNVKMGVSGVAQFKTNMTQAKQAVKTLDAQLALTEKQFKASGDSQDYMTKKAAELQAKLEAQKSVIENAEKALESMASNGVEKSSTAYQKLYQEMLSAKGAMIDTQTELENIGTAGEDAATGVTDANTQLAEIGKGISYQNVTEGLNSITSGLGSIIKKAWQAGEALVRATLGAGSWADDLKTQAEKYSTGDWIIDVEELQKMRNAATQIDTDVESIIAARQKLLKGKGGEDKEVWSFLHDNNIATDGRKTEDIFWDVGEAIMNMTDSAAQEAVAQKVLGRNWADLKPLFKAGREEYEEAKNSMSILTKEQVDNLGEVDDASKKMQNEWDTFQKQILEAFSGPLTEGMNAVTGLLQEFNKYLQSDEGKEKLTQIGDTISTLITDLVNIDPKEVVDGLSTIIDNISSGLRWIRNNKDTVVGAIEAIGAAFVALKLGSVAVGIGKVVSGFKNLFNLGTGSEATASGTATASGGWFTGLMNGANQRALALSAASTVTNMTNLGMAGDWFLNQTHVGRWISNGVDKMFGGEGKFAEEDPLAGVKENAATFAKDWDENVLTQLLREMGQNYANAWDFLMTGGHGTSSWDETDWEGTAYDVMDAIARRTEEMENGGSGNAGGTTGNQSWMSKAFQQALVGMKVQMDGETVGMIVAPYVDEAIAGAINNQ